MKFKKLVVFTCAGLLNISCAVSPKETKDVPQDRQVSSTNSTYCSEERSYVNSDNTSILLCEKMHPTRPYIRPPQDTLAPLVATKTAEVEIYGGLYNARPFGVFVVDRMGRSYKIINSEKTLTGIYKSIKFPSNRVLFTLYRINGKIRKAKTKDALEINVKKIEPVLQLTGKAIDGHYVGRTLEGGYYEMDRTFQDHFKAPLRVKLTGISELKSPGLRKLSEWDSEPKIPDADVYSLDGYIENFQNPVLGSDGKTCFEAVTTAADRNPFIGAATPEVSFHRIGAMHIQGDSVVVLEYPKKTGGLPPDNLGANGMDAENRFLNVINFLQLKYNEELPWNKLNVSPHNANRGHKVKLHAVDENDLGGSTCAP